jgi:hypothetical protein
MGLFKNARESAQNMAQNAASLAGAGVPGGGMPDMANMSMPDPAYVALVNKLGKSGVEAPGELHAIRAVGSPDVSGGTKHEFDVTITPAGGQPYDTTISQTMMPTQLQGLAEGKAVTVKYDPDNPTAALLTSW